MTPAGTYRLVENLSHKQREATPREFADYLVWKLRRRTGFWNLAALWVRRDTVYQEIAGVDCWDEDRNAYLYNGPFPVICHPPCGPHGRYKAVSRQDKYAGPFALSLARMWTGVVEQPASSQLFTGGELVAQGAFGHPAEKLTRLLWLT